MGLVVLFVFRRMLLGSTYFTLPRVQILIGVTGTAGRRRTGSEGFRGAVEPRWPGSGSRRLQCYDRGRPARVGVADATAAARAFAVGRGGGRPGDRAAVGRLSGRAGSHLGVRRRGHHASGSAADVQRRRLRPRGDSRSSLICSPPRRRVRRWPRCRTGSGRDVASRLPPCRPESAVSCSRSAWPAFERTSDMKV